MVVIFHEDLLENMINFALKAYMKMWVSTGPSLV